MTITLEEALRTVDACGGTFTQAETESRFAEGYNAALDAVIAEFRRIAERSVPLFGERA